MVPRSLPRKCLLRAYGIFPPSVRRRVLYHGPVQDVLPHFLALGFECPSRKEPPSFLQASSR